MNVLNNDFEGQKLKMSKAVDPKQVKDSKQEYWPEGLVTAILLAGIVVAALVGVPGVVGHLYVGFINILITFVFYYLKLIKRTSLSEQRTRHLSSSLL